MYTVCHLLLICKKHTAPADSISPPAPRTGIWHKLMAEKSTQCLEEWESSGFPVYTEGKSAEETSNSLPLLQPKRGGMPHPQHLLLADTNITSAKLHKHALKTDVQYVCKDEDDILWKHQCMYFMVAEASDTHTIESMTFCIDRYSETPWFLSQLSETNFLRWNRYLNSNKD